MNATAVMTGWAMDIVSSFLRTDETLDVIVVGLWMLLGITIDNIVLGTQTRMLCSQNGLVPGHHHGWAMDHKTPAIIMVGRGCSPLWQYYNKTLT